MGTLAADLRSCMVRFRLGRMTVVVLLLALAGCSTYGVVANKPLQRVSPGSGYSFLSWEETGSGQQGIALLLAFSGGGTRAAAFAYGVLLELRDTEVMVEGKRVRLLDEIDRISSVSGGSFTAAYYGLHGEKIFEDFEQVFLRSDIEGALLRGLLNPLQWFSSQGRTEMAINYYERQVFRGATFADMNQPGRPQILINASDLGHGVRFTFAQEYFNLLCADLSSYPVSRAVTASSAVPILFQPVVVENYGECDNSKPEWLQVAEERAKTNTELAMTVAGLGSYLDKDKRKFAHLVDGGITDNLALRAFYDISELAGGVPQMLETMKRKAPRHLVLISVNAATDPSPAMDQSNKNPGLKASVGAVTDVQLRRYNVATLQLMRESVVRWADALSTPERHVSPHFIQLGFRDVPNPELRLFFNRVPTSFDLTDEQVDKLIKAGRELLRRNPEFQRLVAALNHTV